MSTYEEMFLNQQKSGPERHALYNYFSEERISSVTYTPTGGKNFAATCITNKGACYCIGNTGYFCKKATPQGNTSPVKLCNHQLSLLEDWYASNPKKLATFFKMAYEELPWPRFWEELQRTVTFHHDHHMQVFLFEKACAELEILVVPVQTKSSLLIASSITRVSPKETS